MAGQTGFTLERITRLAGRHEQMSADVAAKVRELGNEVDSLHRQSPSQLTDALKNLFETFQDDMTKGKGPVPELTAMAADMRGQANKQQAASAENQQKISKIAAGIGG